VHSIRHSTGVEQTDGRSCRYNIARQSRSACTLCCPVWLATSELLLAMFYNARKRCDTHLVSGPEELTAMFYNLRMRCDTRFVSGPADVDESHAHYSVSKKVSQMFYAITLKLFTNSIKLGK